VDRAGVTEITTRLRQGDIVDTLAEQETGAELVLIGKRGEAADFAKGHLGSNLERLMRAAQSQTCFRGLARIQADRPRFWSPMTAAHRP
jgi:hypothetical protein